MRRTVLCIAALLGLLLGCGNTPQPLFDGGQQKTATTIPFRVVSWNLRQFGADGGTAAGHAAVLSALAPDVIAVQEVLEESAFNELTARMPGFESSLGPLASTAGGIRQGWLWRSSRARLRDSVALFTEAGVDFPRPPLEATVDVLDDGGTRASFIAVAVHLKAGARMADEDRRISAIAALETHIRGLVDSAKDDQVLSVGDYNEGFSDPRFATAFAPFSSHPDRYQFLTASFADAGVSTFLPRSLFFDHVISTAGLNGPLDGGVPTIRRFDQEQPDFAASVSDHLPVTIDFTF